MSKDRKDFIRGLLIGTFISAVWIPIAVKEELKGAIKRRVDGLSR